jgi:hypothetical protein
MLDVHHVHERHKYCAKASTLQKQKQGTKHLVNNMIAVGCLNLYATQVEKQI